MEPHSKKQRIVFVNMHSNVMLVRTMESIAFKKSSAMKHRYILDSFLANPSVEICSYINRNGFSYGHGFKTIYPFLSLFRFIEHNFVMKKNKLDTKKVKILRNEKEIQSDDIIVLYVKYPYQFDGMERINAFKAVSLIHLEGNYEECSDLLQKVQPNCIFGESNFFKFNTRFKNVFKWFDNKKFYLLPFVFEDRFRPSVLFQQRKNKAISVGTITSYKGEVTQPVRKQIKENAVELGKYLECYNEYYKEGSKPKEVLPTDGFIIRIIKDCYNLSIHDGQQKKYFSFDMVEKFNEFKMCIVGEERYGIPGIGFVEGMACGCAYIGLNNGLYDQYGLQEGVHYIGYDGTLSDLKAKIEYWQKAENQERLESIARAGREYVRFNCNKQIVATHLLADLLKANHSQNFKKTE